MYGCAGFQNSTLCVGYESVFMNEFIFKSFMG
jgi:hypothetical protein